MLASNSSVMEKDSSPSSNTSQVALRSPQQIAWAKFKANRVGVISTYVVLFFIFLAYGAPLVTKLFGVNSTEIYLDKLNETAMPIGSFGGVSWQHPFGIEPGAGRDVFAMLLYGSDRKSTRLNSSHRT